MSSENNFIESFMKIYSGAVDFVMASVNLDVIGFSALTTYSTVVEYAKNTFNAFCIEYPIIKQITDEIIYYARYTKSVWYNYRIEPKNTSWISTSMLIEYDDAPYFIESYNNLDCEQYLTTRAVATKYEDVCGTNLYNFDESRTEKHLTEILTILKYENQYVTSFVSAYKKDQHKRMRLPLTKSKVSFLSIEYLHPDMDNGIHLELDNRFLLANNCLFSPLFVKRMLEYQSACHHFSDDYTVKIMDSELNMIELKYGQYLRMNENDYVIEAESMKNK